MPIRPIYIVFVTVALAITLAPPRADAGKRRVAIAPFDGPARRATRARATVVRAVAAEHTVLPDAAVARAWRQLGAKRRRPADYARVARAVGADALVTGVVRARGRRATLRLTVRAGATGEAIDTIRVPMRRGRLARTAFAEDLADAIAWAEPVDREPPVAARRRRATAADSGDDAAGPATPRVDAAPTELRATAAPAARVTGPRAAVRAGLSVTSRDLTFSYQASLAPEQRPVAYDGGPVGGVAVAGRVYPSRFVDRVPAAEHLDRVALVFELDRAVGMRSRYSDGAMDYDLPTDQSRWGVGARYVLPLGSVDVDTGIGYGQLRHHIDDGGVDLGVPDVQYRYLDVGAAVAAPVAKRVSARVSARYLAIVGAGEIVTASAYGRAAVRGIDMDAAVAYAIAPEVDLSAGVRYLRVALDFDGTGDMATARDGDPDQDVAGAADRYVGGYVQVGYAF